MRHRLTWHLGPAVSSVRDKVESTLMLSNAMLSLLLSDFQVLPPHDAVNMAAANNMAGAENNAFFIINLVLLVLTVRIRVPHGVGIIVLPAYINLQR